MNEQDNNRKETTPELPLWSYQMQLDSKLAVRTRKDLELQLIARCFEDKEFYQELLANPKGAIDKEFKTQLPQNIEIQVVQETETTLFMVLPYNPYQLSEEELKNFVGMTYEDVALWVYQDIRSTLLDEKSSITLLSRFWKDEDFKQKLLENPKIVIEKELGRAVAEDIYISVLVEAPDLLYIVLPDLTDELHFLEDFPLPQIVEVSTTWPCVFTIATVILCPAVCTEAVELTCLADNGGGGGGSNPQV
jgi:hypothetical protein